MRPYLRYLLLDAFDPNTGELSVRVGFHPGGELGPEVLRLVLRVGAIKEPLEPLRRELETHVRMAIPELWRKGLKLIIHALEEDLDQEGGRNPLRYLWVKTQILHPAEEARTTLNHPVGRQVDILWGWAQRFEKEGEPSRAVEMLERLLLLAPRHTHALSWLSSLFRDLGMVEEMLTVTEQWLVAEPDNLEAQIRRGEAFLSLGYAPQAREVFEDILKHNPLHAMAHLGAAQAIAHAGGDPFPHLDAAVELNSELARAVLKETFDFRLLKPLAGETVYRLDDLPDLLGISPAEVRSLVVGAGLPVSGGEAGLVRESELSRWVGTQNRYQLLHDTLHWTAPTPRALPEFWLPEAVQAE